MIINEWVMAKNRAQLGGDCHRQVTAKDTWHREKRLGRWRAESRGSDRETGCAVWAWDWKAEVRMGPKLWPEHRNPVATFWVWKPGCGRFGGQSQVSLGPKSSLCFSTSLTPCLSTAVSKENHSESLYCRKQPYWFHSRLSWPDTEAASVESCLSYSWNKKNDMTEEGFFLQIHLRGFILIYESERWLKGAKQENNSVCCTFLMTATAWTD